MKVEQMPKLSGPIEVVHNRPANIFRAMLSPSGSGRKFNPVDGNQNSSSLDEFSPLSAASYFQEALNVSVGPSDSFRVYITHPKVIPNSSTAPSVGSDTDNADSLASRAGILFVFHHGAGYSGLSAACFAKEVALQSQGEFGVMSFDCRGHGSSVVGVQKPGPPDLSLSTLSNDLVNLLHTIYPQKDDAPLFVLIGHSMGGAVVTEACSQIQDKVGRVLGLVILDVVEGSAMRSLINMMPLINSRPSTFKSKNECIKYHLDSHTLRNRTSARISVPGLIRELVPPVDSGSSTGDNPGGTINSCETLFTWITDLRLSQPYWEEWYRGLSKKFLAQKTARLLVLAGTDRLDKDLMIGHMQGKYQLSIMAHVGHCLHEDDPSKLAEIIITFTRRNDTSGSDEILARLGKRPLIKKTFAPHR